MFTRSKRTPHNIASASREALRQPQYACATLADGTRLRLRRLSWSEALLLWEEFSTALLGLLACNGGVPPAEGNGEAAQSGDSTPPLRNENEASGRLALPGLLAALPALTLRLAALCAGQDEAELSQREACDVLAIAAAALHHNFIAPRGVADFFAAVAELSG